MCRWAVHPSDVVPPLAGARLVAAVACEPRRSADGDAVAAAAIDCSLCMLGGGGWDADASGGWDADRVAAYMAAMVDAAPGAAVDLPLGEPQTEVEVLAQRDAVARPLIDAENDGHNEREECHQRRVHLLRVLVSKRPDKDAELAELVTLERAGDAAATVVYVPLCPTDAVPFYYPRAVWWRIDYAALAAGASDSNDDDGEGVLRGEIEVRAAFAAPDAAAAFSKHGPFLAKKAVSFANGTQVGRKKKYIFDTVVPRSVYSARRAEIKERYAQALMDGWAEATDPGKHVFEDVSIAAYMVCLVEALRSRGAPATDVDIIDLGCGNGVLVHLLVEEGVRVVGVDCQVRKSWTAPSLFSSAAQASLMHKVLQPSSMELTELGVTSALLLLGNHADELSPWIPFLARDWGVPHFALIPCCTHTFDGRFTRRDPDKGRYATYCEWLVNVAHAAGFDLVREHMRLPSTKNVVMLDAGVVDPTSDAASILRAADADAELLERIRADHAAAQFAPRKPVGSLTFDPPS
ncbi:uncharacterized protein AMSG_00670 [Thecamonas trahens ATCC 50062]|uniref:tRNA (uracil-O(2)-)-methyltransferase n=1 Tax=Thecamonas trahens ATCC 50062 TaxID=461836 RepID=A0A0L0DDY6_THETB|nr:hypothetical protein AMSG_00670 [Thecamonas trahens ATCC 50062]KNC50509.1 hypothetical protein AMSG_00670 [Thecamonas trahens ATCC 50062]|eukprot:XP_013762401.1 hypothetical protein AMSG_00670 [Thecamonas trahens ATCC 50062]